MGVGFIDGVGGVSGVMELVGGLEMKREDLGGGILT